MNRKAPIVILAVVVCLSISSSAGDRFQKIKEDLARAACSRFEFISITEYELFDEVDSVNGIVWIASDGRYDIRLPNDRFLFDGDALYSYSVENNQVVIESAVDGIASSQEISYITRLDEFYRTFVTEPDLSYRLIKLPATGADIPDSLIVLISAESRVLEQILFYDANDELNRLVITSQHSDTTCHDSLFQPTFPDSVERVRL